ncbi:dihydrodipicolinate synthase family protein [Salibacterium halotolerans]|uniref:4-hydroxy-tetrahydrodipicolinate synthase n=1 Tax=Salibacterium halotolerans TaxID=1884432 RepID=A0A1I5LF04_9BACI|nr:dihydrodipicolinate synthase family protein [Salibacterium halotolerans]SFO95880.1 4-hydroxy-tetrahydrodipicolinate synthase [Salibacterium halotolerans]
MEVNRAAEKLKTISAINITPFRGDLTIDWEVLRRNVDFLLDNELDVIVPSGNTGEFYSLTVEEAKEENRKVSEWAGSRAMVVAGIGYAVETAVEMGLDAKRAGADAVLIHMPIHPYMNEEGTAAYFRRIIEEVDMPAVIYFKNPEISDDVLKKLTPLPQLMGVKYAINDLPRFTKIVRQTPDRHGVTWVCGTAEKWAPYFWAAGAEGFTSGLVNLHPEISHALLEKLRDGDWQGVWDLWEKMVPFEDLRARHHAGNNVVVIKEALQMLGFPAGPTREPVSALSRDENQEVADLLSRWKLGRETFLNV